MGRRNYLVEGVSCSGKTTVCEELQRRGHHPAFAGAFDGVFVLTVDRATLRRRLDTRPGSEFGSSPDERALVEELHRTGRDLPDGTAVDATRPVAQVVDEIERLALTAAPAIGSSAVRGRQAPGATSADLTEG